MKKSSEKQFVDLFKEESHKYLDESSQELLRFEKNPDDVEILDGIMRKLHNLKGSATIMGYSDIAKVSHRLEDVFLKLKMEEFSPWEFDLCFSGFDTLGKMIDDKAAVAPQGVSFKELFEKLQNLLKRKNRIKRQAKKADQEKTIDLSTFKTNIKDFINVDVSKVDALVGMISELIVHKGRIVKRPQEVKKILEQLRFIQRKTNQLSRVPNLPANTAWEIENLELDLIDLRDRLNFLLDEMSSQAGRLDRLIDQIEAVSLKMRMLPLSIIFARMERMVRDLAKDKKIKLVYSGEATELDKKIIELIQDPIMHLIRNSVDHGIEDAKGRRDAGKHPEGVIILNAYQRGNRIIIEVEDDGAGIDLEKVKQTALESKIIAPEAAEKMKEAELYDLLFKPGFSTRKEADAISGRGVGLDVVRNALNQLQGNVTVESQQGIFTKFILDLPITVAITTVLMFASGGRLYAVPLSEILETIRLEKPLKDAQSISLRGGNIPAYSIRKMLSMPPLEEGVKETMLIVQVSGKEAAIAVDSLEGEEQVVVKSLGSFLGKVKNVSGAAILSDARLVLVLDLLSLIQSQTLNNAG